MQAQLARDALLYFVIPLWLAAGFADYLCHRWSRIEQTTGARESLIHLILLAEVGAGISIAMIFEINALVIAMMLALYFLHEATAIWDVTVATGHREVTPWEQHVHGYLGLLPLLALQTVVLLHWSQFLALFGLGDASPRFRLEWKRDQIPWTYMVPLFLIVVAGAVLPYVEELWRCLSSDRASGATLTAPDRASPDPRQASVTSKHRW